MDIIDLRQQGLYQKCPSRKKITGATREYTAILLKTYIYNMGRTNAMNNRPYHQHNATIL